MKYVVMRDEETNEIDLVGRFKNKGVAEIWQDGKWKSVSTLHSALLDGLLEDISETEAFELIAKKLSPELQTA